MSSSIYYKVVSNIPMPNRTLYPQFKIGDSMLVKTEKEAKKVASAINARKQKGSYRKVGHAYR